MDWAYCVLIIQQFKNLQKKLQTVALLLTVLMKMQMFQRKMLSLILMVLFLMYGISVKSWGGERKVRKRKRFSNLSLSLDFFPI